MVSWTRANFLDGDCLDSLWLVSTMCLFPTSFELSFLDNLVADGSLGLIWPDRMNMVSKQYCMATLRYEIQLEKTQY